MKIRYLLLAACLFPAAPCLAAPSLTDPILQVDEVVSGLSLPTAMAFIGADDILVLQKNDGKVRRVTDGVLQPGEVLDVAVDSDSERGLLGIALHPDFPTTPFVYLYYTESSTGSDVSGSPAGNRVYRYTWDGSALTTPGLMLDLPATPGPNHNGGTIAFGPDGKLYVVVGDLNRNGQLQNFPAGPAPDDTGVIFRLNDDGTTPTDNPFFSLAGNAARYYAYGVRNSFGMAFDPVTGALWDSENGVSTYDEINMVEPGFNSGWEQIMGPDGRDPEDVSDLFSLAGSHYADPKFSWLSTVGPTAIVFLNSTALGGQYENDLFTGDINNGRLYRFQPNPARNGLTFSGAGLTDLVADNNSELNPLIFGAGFNGITDLKVGPDGIFYVLSFFDGAIYRISQAAVTPPLFIGASSMPDGEVGVFYSADLQIGGGTPSYAVAIVNGLLPPGLSADSDDISGIPTLGRRAAFTLRVIDQNGASVTRQFKINVLQAVGISTRTLNAGKRGKKYSARLSASGGKKPYNWSLTSGVLPSGLTFNSTTGLIAGTPTSAGSVSLTFQVTDVLGGADEKTFLLTIN